MRDLRKERKPNASQIGCAREKENTSLAHIFAISLLLEYVLWFNKYIIMANQYVTMRSSSALFAFIGCVVLLLLPKKAALGRTPLYAWRAPPTSSPTNLPSYQPSLRPSLQPSSSMNPTSMFTSMNSEAIGERPYGPWKAISLTGFLLCFIGVAFRLYRYRHHDCFTHKHSQDQHSPDNKQDNNQDDRERRSRRSTDRYNARKASTPGCVDDVSSEQSSATETHMNEGERTWFTMFTFARKEDESASEDDRRKRARDHKPSRGKTDNHRDDRRSRGRSRRGNDDDSDQSSNTWFTKMTSARNEGESDSAGHLSLDSSNSGSSSDHSLASM